MSNEQDLLVEALLLLRQKTETGKIQWSESPVRGRFITVVAGQTYTLDSRFDEYTHSASVSATDDDNRPLWSAWADEAAPEEEQPPAAVDEAIFALEGAIRGQLSRARLGRLQRSVQALTAA